MPTLSGPGSSGGSASGGGIFGRLVVHGHSGAIGFQGGAAGTYRYAQGWAPKVSRALGTELLNKAVTGATLTIDNSTATPNQPGGYATYRSDIRPVTAAGADRKTAPRIAFSDLYAAMFGSNDLPLAATPVQSIAWVKAALRAYATRCRAGNIIEDSDASWTYTGTWTANTGQFQFNSAGTQHSTSTQGDSAACVLPADYNGEEVAIEFAVFGNKGAVATISADGTALGTLDTTNAQLGGRVGSVDRANGLVYRIPAGVLAPGARTITVTGTTIPTGGTLLVDGLTIGAPDIPLVVLVNMFAQPGVTDTQNANYVLLNTAITELAAEFTDGRVVVADVYSTVTKIANGQPGSMFSSDNFHPNDRGYSVMAQAVLKAILVAPTLGKSLVGPPTSGGMWQTVRAAGGGPGGTLPNGADVAYNAGWSAGTTPLQWRRGVDGRVQWRGAAKASANPPTNATICTVPVDVGTTANENKPALSGATGLPWGVVQIQGTNLVWIAGDANSGGQFLDLSAVSWIAES